MTMDLGTLAILFPMLFLLLGLGFTVVIDPYIQQKQRRIMLFIVVLCLSLIGQNLGENSLFVHHANLALKNILSAYVLITVNKADIEAIVARFTLSLAN